MFTLKNITLKNITLLTSALFTLGLASQAQASPLKLDVYNPGTAGIFPVSSVLVTGKKEAILIDAQFGKSQAEKVVEKIKASGKTLTTIYISHGDPDYYFGLDTIKAAFPNAKVLATPQTVAHIKETVEGKKAYWNPILAADAPAHTIIPDTLTGDHLLLEGKSLKIIDLKGNQPDRSVVWIPSIKAIVGGVVISGSNMHIWMADTQTPKSHTDWLTTLHTIEKLKPKTVIPGHFLPNAALNIDSVKYTENYIHTFDAETAKAKDSTALINAMKAAYAAAGEISSLELSAKVAKGEMKW